VAGKETTTHGRHSTLSTGLQIRNNAIDGAFEAVLDDEVIGRVGYRLCQERVVLTHTEVDEAHRGKGIASQLVQAALDDAVATERRLTNFCRIAMAPSSAPSLTIVPTKVSWRTVDASTCAPTDGT
jgi:hypothetical protein